MPRILRLFKRRIVKALAGPGFGWYRVARYRRLTGPWHEQRSLQDRDGLDGEQPAASDAGSQQGGAEANGRPGR